MFAILVPQQFFCWNTEQVTKPSHLIVSVFIWISILSWKIFHHSENRNFFLIWMIYSAIFLLSSIIRYASVLSRLNHFAMLRFSLCLENWNSLNIRTVPIAIHSNKKNSKLSNQQPLCQKKLPESSTINSKASWNFFFPVVEIDETPARFLSLSEAFDVNTASMQSFMFLFLAFSPGLFPVVLDSNAKKSKNDNFMAVSGRKSFRYWVNLRAILSRRMDGICLSLANCFLWLNHSNNRHNR